MGFSLELVKARRRITELEATVAELQKRLLPPEPPIIKDIIPYTVVLDLYGAIFPNQRDKIFISDLEYEITAISELRRFVDWFVDADPYTKWKDCDDFALALAGAFARYAGWSGFPATFIWGSYLGGHAWFTCIAWATFEDRTPTVFFIEPQSDNEIAEESVEGTDLWLLPMRKIGG